MSPVFSLHACVVLEGGAVHRRIVRSMMALERTSTRPRMRPSKHVGVIICDIQMECLSVSVPAHVGHMSLHV